MVTGGNSGLEQAFSVALAKAGANILAAGIVPEDGATQQMVEAVGVRYVYMEADITKDGVPSAVIERCLKEFGGIDILLNCAGICKIAAVEEFGRDEWDPMVAVNLTAAFELSFYAAKHMIAQRSGKIINICSLFSYLGGQWSPAYAATKHGLAGFTKAYCDELAAYNIQVNGIAPGYYATEITAETRRDPDRNRKVLEHIPAARWGETQDLMGAAVFLASRASDYVNGHLLVVDGGYLVR